METTQDYQVQHQHDMLPVATAEELSRQEFVKSLKIFLATRVATGNRCAYEQRVLPAFRSVKGREPADRHEIRKAMEEDHFYRFWSTCQRSSQEMMWRACQLSVERQLPDLQRRCRAHQQGPSTLQLDPDMEIPTYHTAVDIHCMPGGYHSEFVAEDVANGALYDRAVYLYAMGRMGPLNDDMGASMVAWLKASKPDFRPLRILDLGCTVGHSTMPYCDAFPEAEVHAIDVAAPVLRYAQARANALGKTVHFSQQNAESTSFPDGHFDLIVSHILVHETSKTAFANVMRECHRLLAPGGWVLHSETPPYKDMSEFDRFLMDWDTYYNNEPFWGHSHEIEASELAAAHGFDEASVLEAMAPSAFEMGENRTEVLQCGDFGGAGIWYLYGMQKPMAAEAAA